MAPRKKRVTKNALTARTRSGIKYQAPARGLKKTVLKKSSNVKKTKESTLIFKTTEPMLTRSHKKFGKYRFFTENESEQHVNISKESTDVLEKVKVNDNKVHLVEENLLPEPKLVTENEDNLAAEIIISDDEGPIVEHNSTNDVSLCEENVLQQSEGHIDEVEHVLDCVNVQNTEIMTHQFSNLRVNSHIILDSNHSDVEVGSDCIVENNQYITESGKEDTLFHLDNFESEVIIDCILDDVIPISSEQEIVNENDNYSDTQESDKEVMQNEIELSKDEEITTEKMIEILTAQDIDLTESKIENLSLNQTKDSTTVELANVAEENMINTESFNLIEEENANNTECTQNNSANVEQINSSGNSLTIVEQLNEADNDGHNVVQEEKKELDKCKTKGKFSKKKPDKMEKEAESVNKPSEASVRRSNRIKSISVLKQRSSKGHGLVKHKSEPLLKNVEADNTDTVSVSSTDSIQNNKLNQKSVSCTGTLSAIQGDQKPVKVKSRWRRSSELEFCSTVPFNSNKATPQNISGPESNVKSSGTMEEVNIKKNNEEVGKRLKQFIHLKENLYLTERISCKEAKKMVCDCFLTEEDIQQGEYGCGEDCLNRLLMIECGNPCAVGDRCTNKRFQKGQSAPCEVFRTEKKGLGIRAAANIPYGEFILEYVGEVLNPEEFEKRATEYSKDKNQHYYFMSLRADAVIDATRKGNISRFINHSCDPNAETQKWTVNGELRIGFFSKRTILAGEEITFDYQFQRYGKEAQKCYCEASTCRGWLGEEPDDDEYDEDEDEEEEEEDEEEGEGEETETDKVSSQIAKKDTVEETISSEIIDMQEKPTESQKLTIVKTEKVIKKEKKKVLRQRLPRKDIFEDLDLDDEIETLQTTGLKNQAHTLKLSRLMVRAKEPAQRTKLLRVLRRGELPCRRLFLDYHGLRLIHGWMTDAQHMSRTNKKLESLRLEILQTLATLPIPNKTMLQDSKVLPTVEKWSVKLEESTIDSDSNSPKIENENDISGSKDIVSKSLESTAKDDTSTVKMETFKTEQQNTTPPSTELDKSNTTNKHFGQSGGNSFRDMMMDISPIAFDDKESVVEVKDASINNQSTLSVNDYETEIIALALKLLEEWSVLKEVFRIPKKERIEQMKEHEREADRKYKAGLGLDGQDVFLEKKDLNRYRLSKRQKKKKRKNSHGDKDSSFVDKYERRKLFALQVEQREMERRRSQREFWRQHEQRCVVMGADPRFTAPFEPNQGYQCVWNPQTGQWQNYPLPGSQNFNPNLPHHHHHHHPNNHHHQQQQHLTTGQQNQQQLLMSHGHISSNQPPTISVNHPPPPILPPPIQQNQQNPQIIKHLQPTNLPPPHSLHSKPPTVFNPQPPTVFNPQPPSVFNSQPPTVFNPQPPTVFNPQPPPLPQSSNSSQQQFNIRPPPVLNVSHNLNMQNVNVPNATVVPYGPPPNQHINQQQRNNQGSASIPYPSTMPEHIQQHQPQQAPLPNYHLQSDNQNPPPTQNLMHSGVPSLSSNVLNKPPPPLPALPYQENIKEQQETLQVKFMGPIPPPVKLPPKWKCAKDKYGRPYYYHIRIRKSQWEPPELHTDENEELSESSSSSDTSSLSSESSSEETDSEDDIDDAKLLLQLKNKFKHMDALKGDKSVIEPEDTGTACDGDTDVGESKEKSLDDRLIEEFCFMKGDTSHAKKRRIGLVQEILISPRTEEDRVQFKEDMKRYKQNKEKLKRQKELLVEQSKKHVTAKPSKPVTCSKPVKTSKKHKISVKTKLKEMTDSESAKKIKESFRSSMAVVMVSILNAYRKPECKEGRITNTEDFKHLARKLTHFVMLKELKHCQNIEDLTCTESVKSKAKEFVRKYMSKFGEIYQKPKDEAEFY